MSASEIIKRRKYLVKRPEKDILPSQLTRRYPSTQRISQHTKVLIERSIKSYSKFIDKVKISRQAVAEVIRIASAKKFSDEINRNTPFYITNGDKTNFALVKPGKASINQGLRIIYSHVDSPCLQVKATPIRFEWDPDLKELYLGTRLSTFPYGGIHTYQWRGINVDVIGWKEKYGKKTRDIFFQAYIPDISPQIQASRGTNLSADLLELETGYESEEALLKGLKFDSYEDFGSARLYAVPQTGVVRLKNNLIIGYGHDDRSCVWASIDALMAAKNHYTCIVLGFDKEEIGSKGKTGARGQFFEDVINEIWDLYKPSINERRRILSKRTKVLSGDVDVGSTYAEIEAADGGSIPRIGYGVTVCATDGPYEGDTVSPRYVASLEGLLKIRGIKGQIIGSPHKSDDIDGGATQSEFFSERGMETINVGPPVGSLHSTAEIIHGGDLFWTREAYRAFFESKKEL